MLMLYQNHGIGETLKERITLHGLKINIFQFIVDLAGHKEQLQLLLIDSISTMMVCSLHQLILMPKLWLIAELVEIAMEVIQQAFTDMVINTVFQILPVCNM
jgi:hypothetical protein